jgi:DCN1-like protein 1/2
LDTEPHDAPDTFGINGSMKFLQSIDVGLEEPTVLVIAERLQAPTMGEFSREGFVAGWNSLGYLLILCLATGDYV